MENLTRDQIETLTAKYLERLPEKYICGEDAEDAHQVADKLLCELLDELGLTEIVAKYKSLEKWYA